MITLLAAGLKVHEIPELTLPQFVLLLRAAERRDAEQRSRFVTDLGVTLGGLLGGGSSFKEHLDSLQAVAKEENRYGRQG